MINCRDRDVSALCGKVVAITGASRGLGLALARAAAAGGAEVVVIARASSALERVSIDLPHALCVACDIRAPDEVRQAFHGIAARFGRLDALINNAAVCILHRLDQMRDEDIRREIETNLCGALYCMREAALMMRGGGIIVGVTSESVRWPFPYLSLYAATKAALETLSAGLRAELKPKGIRVSIARCGHIAGGGLGSAWPRETKQAFRHAIETSGHGAFSGAAMDADVVAASILSAIALPASANIDLLEIRAA